MYLKPAVQVCPIKRERIGMDQSSLFIEDEFEALKVDIGRLGGAKVVGNQLWPDKSVTGAAEYLGACLNRDRREKLDYSQIIWIKAEAAKVNSFAAQQYENQQIGIKPPEAVNPVSEAARLKKELIETGKNFERMFADLKRLALPGDDA